MADQPRKTGEIWTKQKTQKGAGVTAGVRQFIKTMRNFDEK
jgi:hypothetical protein